MITISLYLEDELNSLQEIDTLNKKSDKLEKMLLQVKPGTQAERFKNEVNLEISNCYIKMAIFICLERNDNDTAYHLAKMGSVYLAKCQDINRESKKYIDLQQTRMRYYFLFGILKAPIINVLGYEIVDTEITVSFFPDMRNVDNLFIFLDKLHREGLMDPTMSAYQAFIALAGFKHSNEPLTDDIRLILMTDSLKRLSPTHPCYQEL